MEKIKTYGNLLEKIKNEEKFLLYIKSEGCSVCEADFPKVKEITNKNNYTSYYIQADEMAEAVGQLNLYSAPIVLLFCNSLLFSIKFVLFCSLILKSQ